MHKEQFEQSTGRTLELLPGSSIFADSVDDVFAKVFHTTIQSHLHRMVRALDMHHDGSGWAIVRSHVERCAMRTWGVRARPHRPRVETDPSVASCVIPPTAQAVAAGSGSGALVRPVGALQGPADHAAGEHALRRKRPHSVGRAEEGGKARVG